MKNRWIVVGASLLVACAVACTPPGGALRTAHDEHHGGDGDKDGDHDDDHDDDHDEIHEEIETKEPTSA